MSRNHGLWMILGCALPLLLIFILPLFGISGGTTLFIFIIVMFGLHLLMVGHGGHDGHANNKEGGHGYH